MSATLICASPDRFISANSISIGLLFAVEKVQVSPGSAQWSFGPLEAPDGPVRGSRCPRRLPHSRKNRLCSSFRCFYWWVEFEFEFVGRPNLRNLQYFELRAAIHFFLITSSKQRCLPDHSQRPCQGLHPCGAPGACQLAATRQPHPSKLLAARHPTESWVPLRAIATAPSYYSSVFLVMVLENLGEIYNFTAFCLFGVCVNNSEW